MKKLLLLLLPLNLFATDLIYSIGSDWAQNNLTGNYSHDTVQINVTALDRLIIHNASTNGIGCTINGFITDGIRKSEASTFTFTDEIVGTVREYVFFDGNNFFVVKILVIDIVTNIKYVELFNQPNFIHEIQNSKTYIVDVYGNIIYMGIGKGLEHIHIMDYTDGMYILIVNDKRIKFIK